jgi:hypothetical protein
VANVINTLVIDLYSIELNSEVLLGSIKKWVRGPMYPMSSTKCNAKNIDKKLGVG